VTNCSFNRLGARCDFIETNFKLLYHPIGKDQLGQEERFPGEPVKVEVCIKCGVLRLNPKLVEVLVK
jgi:hypothetical protein